MADEPGDKKAAIAAKRAALQARKAEVEAKKKAGKDEPGDSKKEELKSKKAKKAELLERKKAKAGGANEVEESGTDADPTPTKLSKKEELEAKKVAKKAELLAKKKAKGKAKSKANDEPDGSPDDAKEFIPDVVDMSDVHGVISLEGHVEGKEGPDWRDATDGVWMDGTQGPQNEFNDEALQEHIMIISEMNKSHAKRKLEVLGLDTKGSHEQLLIRLKEAHTQEWIESMVQHAADTAEERARWEAQQKAAWEEEQRLNEQENLERERARAHLRQVNSTFARQAADMKAPALRRELDARGLSTKGKKGTLLERLAHFLENEPEALHGGVAVDAEFAEEEDGDGNHTQSRMEEIREQKAMVREQIEEKKAMKKREEKARKLAEKHLEKEMKNIHPDDRDADPELQKHLITIRKMNKGHLKKQLERRKLSRDGTHADLCDRLVKAHRQEWEEDLVQAENESEQERLEREEQDRLAWEEELSSVVMENEAKDAALEHLLKLNKAFASLKAPGLREELKLRNLSTKGKKADLMERLAYHLEEEHRTQFGHLEAKNEEFGVGVQNDEADADVEKPEARESTDGTRGETPLSKKEELEAKKAAKKAELMAKKAAKGNKDKDATKPLSKKEELEAKKAAKKAELMAKKAAKSARRQDESTAVDANNEDMSDATAAADDAAATGAAPAAAPQKLSKKEELEAKKAAKKAELLAKKNAKGKKKGKAAANINPDDEDLDPKELQNHLMTIRSMNKSQLKKQLKKRGLDVKGSHDQLAAQLVEIHRSEFALAHDETRLAEESDVERLDREERLEREAREWEEEQALVAAENAAKEEAIAHLMKLNSDFAIMKAPALRKELKARGMGTNGKKVELIERLAQHLEEEHAAHFGSAEQVHTPDADSTQGPEEPEFVEWRPTEFEYDDQGEFRLMDEATKLRRQQLADEAAHRNVLEIERHSVLENQLEAEREAAGLPQLSEQQHSDMNVKLNMFEKMSKAHLRKHLEKRGLDATGNRVACLARLQDDETEATYHRKTAETSRDVEVERLALQAEMAQVAEENEEKHRAEQHLRKLGSNYGMLKAPALRKELKKRGLSTKGKKAVLLERLAMQLEEDMENGIMKAPEKAPTSASMLLSRIEEETTFASFKEQQEQQDTDALAEEEARLNPKSRKARLAKGTGKLAAKGAIGLTAGSVKAGVRVTKSAAKGTLAAQQAAQASLTDAAKAALEREEYDSDGSDGSDGETKGFHKRMMKGVTSIVKGSAKAAMNASTAAASAGITTTVNASLGLGPDGEPAMKTRFKPGFNEYLEERISHGTFDTHGWTDPAMVQEMEERLVRVEFEYERKLTLDDKQSRADTKAEIKRHKDWEKTPEGKAHLRMEAAQAAQRQVEQARIEAQKQVAEAAHVKHALTQQRERERLAVLDFEEPPKRMAIVLEARKELEKQDAEYSIFTEFQKDPRDPEGEYLAYLCNLEQKDEDAVLDWFRRMRLKHNVVLEVESDLEEEEEEEEEEHEYVMDENGELVRVDEVDVAGEEEEEEEDKKKKKKKMKKKKKKKVRAHHKDHEVDVEEENPDVTHDHNWEEEWEDFSDLVPPGPDLEAALFKAIDKDGGGELDLEEFKLAVGLAIDDPDAIEASFRKIDTDGGGSLDLNEFRRGVTLLLEVAGGLTSEELLEKCIGGGEVNPLPTFHCHMRYDFHMSVDDHGFMRALIDGEEIFIPGGSIGAIRPQLEERVVERVARRVHREKDVEPVKITTAMQVALDAARHAEQMEFENEGRRESARRTRAADEAELKRQFEARLDRESEKRRAQEEALKTAEQQEKDRLDREHELERQKLYADHDEWEKMARRRRKQEAAGAPGIRSPYEVLNELRTHCDRYTEEFPFIWDRFVDVFHDLREHVVANMQRSLQVCKMLPKLADRKRRLQNEMIETLINYEHDVSLAKFEGVNVDDEHIREEKIIEVVDGYLQLLGKFERKRFMAMTKEGDLLLARRMATQHLHDYWKEHSRVSAGLYNYMVDLDRQVEGSLHSIPRDTIDMFRDKMMLELDLCEELTEEEHTLPDPLEPFTDEGRQWAQSDYEDQQLSGHHSENNYAPDLPGCYWTSIFDGSDGMMMEPEPKKANHDGSGHTGTLICDDGETYWARVRRGVLELWNRELPAQMAGTDMTEDTNEYYIEREIILLYLYTFVKIPVDTNEHGFLVITGTLHAEEFTCESKEDLSEWVESIERARRWAVDKEELRQFTGGDDDNIAYDEFMEFQKKKQEERALQLAKMNKKLELEDRANKSHKYRESGGFVE